MTMTTTCQMFFGVGFISKEFKYSSHFLGQIVFCIWKTLDEQRVSDWFFDVPVLLFPQGHTSNLQRTIER